MQLVGEYSGHQVGVWVQTSLENKFVALWRWAVVVYLPIFVLNVGGSRSPSRLVSLIKVSCVVWRVGRSKQKVPILLSWRALWNNELCRHRGTDGVLMSRGRSRYRDFWTPGWLGLLWVWCRWMCRGGVWGPTRCIVLYDPPRLGQDLYLWIVS